MKAVRLLEAFQTPLARGVPGSEPDALGAFG
jgi:hypothetical protein